MAPPRRLAHLADAIRAAHAVRGRKCRRRRRRRLASDVFTMGSLLSLTRQRPPIADFSRQNVEPSSIGAERS
ncbi:MAG: hypothetical protein WBL23_11410 [Salinisphaera sp.]|uniref:hypothetical protein n=1 Tax=Salinisphaera sp. TaxID=1914330 RepID=UPI003C7EA208